MSDPPVTSVPGKLAGKGILTQNPPAHWLVSPKKDPSLFDMRWKNEAHEFIG